jgi:hypothetical protein
LACDAHQEVGSPALAMLEAESNTNKARGGMRSWERMCQP